MSEFWVRLLVVGGAVAAVVLVTAVLRRRARRGRALDAAGLRPGTYLFTSGTCADCLPARVRLAESVGPRRFTEIEWERDPDLFTKFGIEVVPCTVVVNQDGSATSFPGMPGEALETLNP